MTYKEAVETWDKIKKNYLNYKSLDEKSKKETHRLVNNLELFLKENVLLISENRVIYHDVDEGLMEANLIKE